MEREAESPERQGPDRRRWAALALVLVVALGVRIGQRVELAGTALDRWHRSPETDMATYLEQARRMRGEGWLAIEPYHPWHGWQRAWPEERWLAWYGPHAFHQAPLYAWALAARPLGLGAELDGDLGGVKLVQLLLGVAGAGLAFLVGARLAGSAPIAGGLGAGLLAATYGPLVHLEAQVLREGAGLAGASLFALLLVRLAAEERPRVGAAAQAGLLAGLLAMLHESGSVLALAGVAVALGIGWARAPASRRPRGGAVLGGVFLAGALAGFAPLLARNLAVGAAPFAVSCRAHVNLAETLTRGVPNAGAVFASPDERVAGILDEGDGSFFATLGGIAESWEGDLGGFVAGIWERWSFQAAPHEEPDNTSWPLFRGVVGSLGWLPDFRVLFPLAAGGILLVLWSLVRRGRVPWPMTSPGAPEAALVLLALLAALSAALAMTHVVGRFRLFLVPFLLPFAGVWVAGVWGALRRRSLGTLAVVLALAVLGAVLQRGAARDYASGAPREADMQTLLWLVEPSSPRDVAQGLEALEVWRELHPRDARFALAFAAKLEQAGDADAAAEARRRAR